MTDVKKPRLESPRGQAATASRPPFGIARAASQRIELVFALRSGGSLAVTHELSAEATAETLERFCAELRQAVAAGREWGEFADAWSGSGQRAYLQLSEVIGFSARPAR
jgi:hypothetical protein